MRQADEYEALDSLGMSGRIGCGNQGAQRMANERYRPERGENALQGIDMPFDAILHPGLGRSSEAQEVDEHNSMLLRKLGYPRLPISRGPTQPRNEHQGPDTASKYLHK